MTNAYASSILRKTLCYASRSKKPQNQTQRADFPKKGNLQKPKPFSFMLILLALLCSRTVAWAQAQGEWTGSETTGEFYVTSNKTINSTVTIGNTDELTLQIKADVTISRDNSKNLLMFWVKPGGTLNIIGEAKPNGGFYKATFVGGSTVILDDLTHYPEFEGDYVSPVTNKMGIVYNNLGNVTIMHARITGFQVRSGDKGSRGVINLVDDDADENPNSVSTGSMWMEDVEIDHCWGGPAVETGHIKNSGRIINLQAGNWNATLKNVELHHCFSCEHPENSAGIHHFGGIIRTEGGLSGKLTVEDCRFYNNKYKYWKKNDCQLIGQGGVINWRAAGPGSSHTELIIKDSKFYYNQAAEGGAIATNAKIKMSNVEINNNKAKYGGGVYFWTYNGAKDEYDGRAFDAIFENGVNIHDNTATQYGGGIYIGIDASDDVGFKAKTSGEEWNPVTDTASVLFNVEIQTGATIEGNKAPKGAGIAIRDAAPYRHMNNSPYLVVGNGDVPNPAYGEWSGVYRREVNIAGGTVCNNIAQGTTGDEMVAGAGIYIEKYEYPADHTFHQDYNYGNAPGTYGAGTLTVNAESGLIYGNKAIYGTKPGFGGGMYIASKFTNNTIVSTLNVNIGKEGKDLQMYNNQAYTDGGGVYVWYDREDGHQNEGTVTVKGGTIGKTDLDTGNKALNGNGGGICVKGGTVVVKGGKIEYNTAGTGGGGLYVSVPNKESITTIQGNASISHNTANNGNGGGVCLDKGRINIYGSDISNNKATKGNGGGLYIEEGDILVWSNELLVNPNDPSFSQCEATKTTVLNNKAGGNGGGLNTHRGRFDVRFAQIKNNTAGYNYSGNGGGNGGGLFCDGTDNDNGYTVRLLHCDLEENKALGNVLVGDGITGRGGGVYLKHGSIFAEHCDIIKNEADINGGGLDNHSGELRVYGTYIDENVAHEGRGGGLYTEEGNIVVGPCDTYGYTASKASRIILNRAKLNGGGINNHRGDITIHGDIINENEAETGDGGGVYIKEGDIHMYGGQINNNKANKGKGGGVYGGGGKFNIKERKANPIVEIMEVEDIMATKFKVHYHLVDRGWAPTTTPATALSHGIAYSSTKDPSTTPWTTASDSTVITYNAETHEYVLSEGCVRVPSGRKLSANTTYYVIAWAKYTIIEGPNAGNYYDASPVVEIKTKGSIAPVVATDRVSDISATSTTASATVSGELLYEGDGSGTVTKGIRYRTGENEWTSVLSSSTVDEFSVNLTGLAPNTDYQAQAYATKGENTGYGEIIPFTTTTTGGKAPQGPRSVYPAVEENPFFMELTPLQQAMLASTPEGDTTAAPASRAITDRDDPNPKAPENIPQINGNTARYGGGICIDKNGAELIFAGSREAKPKELGQINENYASEAGGGIYIGYQTEGENPGPAMMQMMGKCEVNYNRVPETKHGGGIYLDGRLYVGDKDTDLIGTHGLLVDKNYAINKDQATFDSDIQQIKDGITLPDYNKKTLNNVFLSRNEYDYHEHDDEAPTSVYNKVAVITLLSDISGYVDEDGDGEIDENETKSYSNIGFSVTKGFCPVIATSNRFGGDYNVHFFSGGDATHGSEAWLHNLMNMSANGNAQQVEALRGAVFEDSESYVAIHIRQSGDGLAPFRWKYIYLWGCWTHPIVQDDPETELPMKGSSNSANPNQDPKWKGHYVITNPDQNTADGKGDPLEWEIYSPEGLSWFTSYVNGLNAFDQKTGNDDDKEIDPETNEEVEVDNHHKWYASKNPKASAKIMNDLDMSAYLWVPIGSVQKFYNTALASEGQGSLFVDSETPVKKKDENEQLVDDEKYTINAHYYQGTFDGQGHIIKGLQGLYLTGIKKFGLFGYLADDAVVMNTFVDEGLFVSDNEEVVYSAGGIAGTMKLRPLEALGVGEQNGEVPVISNSEARMNFNATYSESGTTVGGLVGDMENGHIHSCMAMPNFTPGDVDVDLEEKQYMGGLVGKMEAGTTLKNSFSNVEFLTSPAYKVGGIAGENNGIIENVYVRYRNDDQKSSLTLPEKFYWFVGNNPDQTGGQNSINFCYAPDNQRDKHLSEPKRANNRRGYLPTNLVDNKYGFAHKDQQMVKKSNWNEGSDVNDYADNANGAMVVDSLSGLLRTLNKWVAKNSGYTPWTRTMASTINDDYPVLMFNDFNVVGTEDGIYMKYDDNVNDMWKKPNYESLDIAKRTGKNFQGLTSYNNPKAAMYLYKTNPTAINVSRNEAVRLYIHENVGVTQTDGAELHARVGVTFDNSNGSPLPALGGKPYDWHMFSSALTSASMGLKYHTNEEGYPGVDNYYIRNNFNDLSTNGILHDHYVKRIYMDPPKTTWFKGNVCVDSVGYFPTNTPYGTWRNQLAGENGSFDFYCFHEESRHWINFKREGTTEFMDHWHQDIDGSGKHQNLRYENESTLRVGKGYMMGVSAVSMLMADGILNNGVKSNDEEPTGKLYSAEKLTNSDYGFNPSGYSEELRGTNLVGNPFQSYLNFSALANDNDNKNIIENGAYYLFDADARRYLCYPTDASTNPINAPQFIHPHQGFFVKTANGGYLTFKNSMRSATAGNGSTFRGDNLNYPLVNLFCYDAEGHYDVTTVEMNRPKLGGGLKLKDMRNGNSLIYARLEDEDYQTLFAPTGTSTVPVRFEPSQDGVYTMRWGTLHGDFHYLHLVDNMSGADVDMLRSEEYRFEATTTDYISRFKLVFEVTDVEENPIEAEATTFAFCMGDELIVNGAGYLEVFDVQGRRLSAKRLVDAQSSVSLPNVAAGIYFLRLSDDKQVRTQKMVINY